MPKFVGFQTMVILDHNGVTFDTLVWPFNFYLNLTRHTVQCAVKSFDIQAELEYAT